MKLLRLCVLLVLVALVEIDAQRHDRQQRRKYYKGVSGRQFNPNRNSKYELDNDIDEYGDLDDELNIDSAGDDDDNDDDELNNDYLSGDIDDVDELKGDDDVDDTNDIDTNTDNYLPQASKFETSTAASAPTTTSLSAPTATSETTTAPQQAFFRRRGHVATSPNSLSSEDVTAPSSRALKPTARSRHSRHQHHHHHHRGHHRFARF